MQLEEDRVESTRNRTGKAKTEGIPLPWVPPLPLVDHALRGVVNKRLVAEAVVARNQGVADLLRDVGMEGAAHYAERLVTLCADVAAAVVCLDGVMP